MSAVLFVVEGFPVSVGEALAAAAAACLALTLALALVALRGGGSEARLAELSGRLSSLGEWLGTRQTDLARLMAERLDAQTRTTGETLGRLNERLAVIDAAQDRLTGMAEQMVSLKDILANKQTRGAFGQGRMETIVRDGLPPGAYAFQPTLANKTRPDCVIRLPGDPRPLVIDAKFPLEGIAEFRRAQGEEAQKFAARRVRADLARHIADIADKYLNPGETQDVALMFVPSESIYADLVEHFEDVVQRAHRARVVIVSPSLMMMAIQVAQSMLRDAAVRESVHTIQAEVGKLVADARRLAERVVKLEGHFRAAQDDLGEVLTSAEKVTRRAQRIDAMDFAGPDRAVGV
ncbi:MAG: DNA recombination protein RmuC [Pseudomonadota bacterium]|nr:DNA recombination protein RmuC [Pseudomonadota bacterium]